MTMFDLLPDELKGLLIVAAIIAIFYLADRRYRTMRKPSGPDDSAPTGSDRGGKKAADAEADDSGGFDGGFDGGGDGGD